MKFCLNVPKTQFLMKIISKLEADQFCNTKIHHEFALNLGKISFKNAQSCLIVPHFNSYISMQVYLIYFFAKFQLLLFATLEDISVYMSCPAGRFNLENQLVKISNLSFLIFPFFPFPHFYFPFFAKIATSCPIIRAQRDISLSCMFDFFVMS